MSDMEPKQLLCKCAVSTIIIWKKNSGQLRSTPGKMQKFATVSSQISINVVCSKNSDVEHSSLFLFHLWEIYKNRVDPCRYYNIVSSYIKK